MTTDRHPRIPLFNLTPADRAEILRVGPIWGKDIATHRDITVGIYARMLEKAPTDAATITRDLRYGDDPRQVLDVFVPKSGARNADVMVFVHGGAFVRGDKVQPGGMYDNVLHYFARKGMVGVNVEYRLGDKAPYPGGAEDVRDAVAWVRANIARHGGDPGRIFLFGHSAGGTHAATFACDPRVRPAGGTGLAGLILVSGRLRADVSPENPNAGPVKIYFGADTSKYDERSPVTYADRCDVPLFIGLAQYENPLLDIYGLEFAQRVAARNRRAPRVVQVPGHNHNSIIAHFNTEEEILGLEMVDFVEGTRG
jgi:acetyl esterase/lipase